MNEKLIENLSIVVFGEDYNRHPHALEHIINLFIPRNKILWVETMGLRTPKFNAKDIKRSFQKLYGMLQGISGKKKELSLHDNITVIAPFMLPFNRINIIRYLNKCSVVFKVKRYLKSSNTSGHIVITSVPNACDYVGELNEVLSVYFCVDELSLWPGFDYELVRDMENLLLEKVNLIIATADILAAKKKLENMVTPVITHGVTFGHFNLPRRPINSQCTKICYFGTFDERSDQEIIKYAAENLPGFKFFIIGTIEVDVSRLIHLENVFFLPKVAYVDLPEAIKDMDIFILPYKLNEFTKNINPLKLKECMSTGRPVICTPLPEIVKLGKYLYLAANGKEFTDFIQKINNGVINHEYDKVIQYIKQNETWEIKAKQFSRYILNRLLDK